MRAPGQKFFVPANKKNSRGHDPLLHILSDNERYKTCEAQ